MSLAIEKQTVVNVLSPVVDYSEHNVYAAVSGGVASTTYAVQPNSGTFSASGGSFSFVPPSPKHSISRRIVLQSTITIQVSAVVPVGAFVIAAGQNSFRQFPLHAIMDNAAITINGTTLNYSMISQYIHALSKYNADQIQQSQSGTPCYPDTATSYATFTGSAARNALADLSCADAVKTHRGGFGGYKVITNPASASATVATVATVSCTVSEVLMLPILTFGMADGQGLTNLSGALNLQRGERR